MTVDSSPAFQFGPFRLEISERRLLRDGQVIPLRTKVFDTLQLLVEHSGRLLTKRELMERLWPDAVVEENNLAHNISTLRRALGEEFTSQRFIETVPRVGYRFVAPVSGMPTRIPGAPTVPPPSRTLRQEIRFCTALDGARIAYSTTGRGTPFVKTANWLNHLEFEWESPVWKHWLETISARHTCVRYDERGCGLSDWNVDELSFDSWVKDLETVVNTLAIDDFVLLGISQGAAVAAAYAARHPERVNRLVLFGGFARGWHHWEDPRFNEARAALVQLLRLGWGQSNPEFQQVFTTHFIPDAGPEQIEWFNDLQRVSTSPENAARMMEEFARVDVRGLLGEVKTPTMVLHADADKVIPFDEGRLLAAGIPGARFVPLPSRNHLLLEHEPAWQVLARELGEFLGW